MEHFNVSSLAGARKMRKFLFVISHDWYLLSHRSALINTLLQKGHRVYVITRITDEAKKLKIEKMGCQLINSKAIFKGIAFFSSIQFLYFLIRQFCKIKPDIIHAVSIRTVFLSLIAFYFSSAKKMIVTIAGLGTLTTSKNLYIRALKKIIFLQ